MNLILKLAFAFLFGVACCYGELSFNCSDKKIFLSNEFSLYYDTLNPMHEVLLQRSLHKLRSVIGQETSVSRVPLRDSVEPEPEPELEETLIGSMGETAENGGTLQKLTRQISKFGERIKPKPKPVTTKHATVPHHETTKPHETTKHPETTKHHGTTKPHGTTTPTTQSTTSGPTTTPNPPVPESATTPRPIPVVSTTPRPAPVVTTTTQSVPDTTTTQFVPDTTTTQFVPDTTTTQPLPETTTTPEGRRTTQSVPETTTTPERRRTTQSVPETTTTPERRRTTSTATTTPERRRTTAALPVVIDLEMEVDMGRGASLLVTINGRGRGDRKFELVIDAPTTHLTADSLSGAIRGLEVIGQLMGTNQNGEKYLPECTVY